MQTERRVAANSQTKPTDLGCESADRLLSSADTVAIYYYYSARKLGGYNTSDVKSWSWSWS